MNALAEFLSTCEQVCPGWGCDLHPFFPAFFRQLRCKFPTDEQLSTSLSELSGADLASLPRDRLKSIEWLLNDLPLDQQEIVVDHWLEHIVTDPELALSLLIAFNCGGSLPQPILFNLINAAAMDIALDRELRTELRRLVPDRALLPSEIVSAIEHDEHEEQEVARAEQVRVEKRNAHFDSLAQLPFRERVPRLISEKRRLSKLHWRDFIRWSRAWSRCTDEDVAALDATAVQHLIDLCVSNQTYYARWHEALHKLYDRRHQLRLEAMEAVRQRIGHLPPGEQMTALVRDPSIPIEHFPAELRDVCSAEWIGHLSDESRERIVKELERTRLRRWKRVLDQYTQSIESVSTYRWC